MRLSFVLIAVAASSVSGSLLARQSAGDFPQCALPCIGGQDLPTGDCGPTDNVCLCKNEAFVAATTACIDQNCQGDEIAKARAAAQQICAAVGVTLTSTPPTPSATSSQTESGAQSSSAPQSTPTSPTSTSRSTGGSSSGANTSAATSSGSSPNTSSSTNSATAPPAQSTTPNSAFSNAIPATNAFAGMIAIALGALAL